MYKKQRQMKINTLFWIAILGLILTTAYTSVLVTQGLQAKRRIDFIYYRNKREAEKEINS